MKEKLTVDEKNCLTHIKVSRIENPVPRRFLAYVLGRKAEGITCRTVQKIVNSLRSKGYPILSSSTPGNAGYYWPRNEKELEEGIWHLRAPTYDTIKITSNMAGYFQRRKQMRLR